MRDTILIRGARENNLTGFDVEIPRDALVVLTGVSGSGKSSLAFDTLYAEGQRRFLESLSAWARRFVQQQRRPAVDAILGLSPVISIEQKTISKNPRSTVGTMTDIGDYLRLLYATSGQAHCLRCDRPIPTLSARQLAEHVLSLPEGTPVELCTPLEKPYGEPWSVAFQQVRTRGCRRVRIDDVLHDLADTLSIDDDTTARVEAVADRIVVQRHQEKQLVVAIESALAMGEGFVRFRLPDPAQSAAFCADRACPEHHLHFGETGSWYFSFNEAESACVTCSGLGTYLRVHTGLLVPDPTRSILSGAFVAEAIRYDKNSWNGRILYSMAQHYGFSLETPFQDLSERVQQLLFFGTGGEEIVLLQPPGGAPHSSVGKRFRFDGVAGTIERHYRGYRQKQEASSGMEDWLRKVMVERPCPDCHGVRVRRSRRCVRLGTHDIHALGQATLGDARASLAELPGFSRGAAAGVPLRQALMAQLDLLIDIGLDYLALNRPAATLSGGESQRIRLSTQISSELMGMLYVLDEPSIGLHPKDNARLIATLRRLRDIGNTVIVVEHDAETIEAADHVIEIGPGPGVHGGRVVSQGTVETLRADPNSLTGAYLSGRKRIENPAPRRAIDPTNVLTIRGARENNLKNLTVAVPLGVFVCVTGASGSGKSTLVNGILTKRLLAAKIDSRILPGEHDAIDGIERLGGIVAMDQSPIGRSPRSNPATYVGFYDDIRTLFATTDTAQRRGYTPSRFSFNVKGGRCEECGGEGTITTRLNFLPDVEAPCPACKGARYNAETLEVLYNGRSIADVLALSIEEGVSFFAGQKKIASRLTVLAELGLGYLTLGHPAPLLSGGEAQRIKLATELARLKRGAKTLYVLDEPTTGLHLADIQRLLDCLQRLVDAGNTVVVIEHHLDVIRCADWVIDLGPDGGRHGGEVVAVGPPEAIAACERSHTGRFLSRLHSGGS
jgi:excinuclease ABC subunit A